MRITRLHILLILIGIVLMGYGVYTWMTKPMHPSLLEKFKHWRTHSTTQAAPTPRNRPATTTTTTTPLIGSDDAEKAKISRMLADIGETYKHLPKPSGEVQSITHPLRMAKDYLSANQIRLAKVCASEAWAALQDYKKAQEEDHTAPTSTTSGDIYEVVKGDTLWRIARDQSPVHQGPGWVTIWKANKKVIKDFNRIEVGLNLKIPAQVEKYIEPYWRPRQLARATKPAQAPMSLAVNLPELLASVSHMPPKKGLAAGQSLYAYLAARETGNVWANSAAPSVIPAPETTAVADAPESSTIDVASLPHPAIRFSPFRRADFAVSARPFLESPQYQ